MLRLFVALPVPDCVADIVQRAQLGLDGAKWSPRENLHVTLRFLGDVDERQAEDVDSELAAIKTAPFDISGHGIGFFGAEQPHAVWVGIDKNAPLEKLQKDCERACRRAGLEPDTRAYTPHMTICYLPRHFSLEKVTAFQSHNNLLRLPTWQADRFYLYASRTRANGPSQYTIEAEYPL